MSADTLPITPARFAAALKDLSLVSLHLKVLELRNSIAHLDYSIEQLRPFAEGLETALSASATATASSASDSTSTSTSPAVGGATASAEPDQDCIDAIKENEAVIERMQERIRLIRAEVEARGCSWTEFQGAEELEDTEPGAGPTSAGNVKPVGPNGVNGHAATPPAAATASATTSATAQTQPTTRASQASSSATAPQDPWQDGTFETGVIWDGEMRVDAEAGRRSGASATGGRLSDEELRRMLAERLGGDGSDGEDGGMHL